MMMMVVVVITVLDVGGTGGIDGDGDYGVGDDGGGDGSCNGDDSNNVGMVVINYDDVIRYIG